MAPDGATRRSAVDRMACVEIPALPLQLLLRAHPGWKDYPAAVVDRDKAQGTLLWVNREAARHRIRPGQRYAAALSLCAELRAGVVDDDTLRRTREEIVERLRHFSAGIEPSDTEPGVFWIDASGLSLLYPSLERWGRIIVDELESRRLHARLCVGFSRFGTRVLTRAGDRVRVLDHPPQELRAARRVALRRLPLRPQELEIFEKLGVRTLAEFVDLPAAGIRKRFGEDIHRLHRLATGDLWAPLQPLAPPDPLERGEKLDYGETDLDRLLHRLEEHLLPLRARLLQRRRLLRALRLRLHFEKGEPMAQRLQPAQPTVDLAQVLQLLRLRLEGLDLGGGVTELHLHVEEIEPSRDQMELFAAHARRDRRAADRAFARLRAELGDDAVQVAELREGHLPQARFRWRRLESLGEASPRLVQRPPLVRRMHGRGRVLSRQRRREPDGWMIAGLEGGAVEEVLGPYVVSGGWWARPVHREYHFVRTANAGWLWVYFDRRRRRWMLQGAVE